MDLSFRIITSIKCIAVIKNSKLSKHHIYKLHIIWSSGVLYIIKRSYSQFFDLRTCIKTELKEAKSDAPIPPMPNLVIRSGSLNTKDEKRRKDIEKFCKEIINLPALDIIGSSIRDFFEPWRTDENDPIIIDPEDLVFLPQPIQNVINIDRLSEDIIEITPTAPPEENQNGINEVDVVVPVSPEVFDSTDCENDQTQRPISETISHIVVHNYEKLNDSEISLKAGNFVEVLDRNNTGWWFIHDSQTSTQGWAPGAFLKPVHSSAQNGDQPKPFYMNVNINEKDMEYQVTRNFTASKTDEISLNKDDIVNVLKLSLDGWWLVRCNNATGLFPAVILEKVTKDHKAASLRFQRRSLKGRSLPPRSMSVEEQADYQMLADFANNEECDTSSQDVGALQREGSVASTVNENHFLYRLLSKDSESEDDEVKYAEIEVIKPRAERKKCIEKERTEYTEILQFKNQKVDNENIYDNALRVKTADESNLYPNLSDDPPELYGKIDKMKSMMAEWDKISQQSEKDTWLHGLMTREECEIMLLNGNEKDFMIRKSLKNQNAGHTLSVLYKKKVRHFQIQHIQGGSFQIGKHVFSDLSAIVKYYKNNPLFYYNEGTPICLEKPFKS